MVARKDCVTGVAARTGRDPKDVEADLREMLDRADGFEEEGEDYHDALGRAGLDMMAEHQERARLARRAAVMDARKDYERRRDYRQMMDQIEKFVPANAPKWMQNLVSQSAHLALEAKLVGVNLPFLKNRQSIDAQYVALREKLVGGFSYDLEHSPLGNLSKVFASREIEKDWAAELFEMSRGGRGSPGKTKKPAALEIAKIIQKWQKSSIDAQNREGAWIRSYSGYITKTSHDADAIRAAGPETWANATIDKLDLKRTFGTTDRLKALDTLRQLWTPFSNGDHFDYGAALDEPVFPSIAKKASAPRELHFLSGADWIDYNAKYGVHNPTMQVVESFRTGARRLALLKGFGTKPGEAFEADIAHLKAALQSQMAGLTTRIELMRGPNAPSGADTEAEIAKLEAALKAASLKFNDFNAWETPLRNRFAQIDGSSMKPVNTTKSHVLNGWMAINRMTMLGRVFLTHFASLPLKSAELRYWNIAFGDRMAGLFAGLTRGAEGSGKRQVLDSLLVGFEARLGHMMARYDVADAAPGWLGKWETMFWKLTGVSGVVDNQRGDAEAMMAAHVGGLRGQAWDAIGPKEQRVLGGFGIGAPEWAALHNVPWSEVGGRRYLFPSDVERLTDDDVRAYLAAKPRAAGTTPNADEIARTRENLALMIATAYTDRAGFAVPMADARTRAMMFGKNFEPGTTINTALRLLYQFKMWPAAMVTRAWGREIYGAMGDPKLDRVAGIVEMIVAAAIFGTAAETVRAEIQGIDGLATLREHPTAALLAGLQRSGVGTIMGDFLLGEYDRHGFSAVDSLAGPTFGQIDTIMDLVHAGGSTTRHPWQYREAQAVRIAKEHAPFLNLWMTSLAMNQLVWYRLQDWINPGYTARMEKRMRDNQGTQFWLSPQTNVIQAMTGAR